MQQHYRGKSQTTVEREFKTPNSACLKCNTMAGRSLHCASACRILVLIVIVLNLLLLGVSARAQWRRVLGRHEFFRAIYFLDLPGNPRIGFVGGLDTVFRTEDGGNTWYPIQFHHGTIYDDYIASGFAFKDSLNGWMSVSGIGYWGGAYKTTDGGKSWNFLPGSGSSPMAIYYDSISGGLFLSGWDVTSFGNYTSLVSWDGGTTWQPILASLDVGFSGFAFNDPLHGIITYYPFRTSDGGHTWSQAPIDSEIWQALAIPGTLTQFAITDYSGTVLRTDDMWNTWKVIHHFPFTGDTGASGLGGRDYGTSSGAMEGDSCHLFVRLRDGCYMSTDQGITWSNLGGGVPWVEYIGDQRFYAKGNTIFISTFIDGSSTVWKLDLDSLPAYSVGISSRLADGTQQTTLHPGDSVGVTFVPGAGTLAATDSVSLTLRYDPNAVSLSSLQVPAGWWISDSASVYVPPPFQGGGQGVVVLHLTLRSDSAESLPDPLLHAEFHTYLTPSEDHPLPPPSKGGGISTFIYLDNAQSYFPQTTPCAATALSLDSPDSVEIDFTGCGNQTLLDVMQGQPPFRIESIVPNPAATVITVTVAAGDGSHHAGIECELFDALGNSVLTQHLALSTEHLDVSRLPPGIYFLRLSSGGYAVSRSISIER